MTELKDVEIRTYIDGKKDKGLMSDKQAYKTVLHELMAADRVFTGEYDAKRNSPDFINGVWFVMRAIAFGASEGAKEYVEFANAFVKNVKESEDSALPF